MDYNLEALSWRQFEQMTQALCLKVVGPGVSVFGDGPDGGREATWQGDNPSLGSLDRWNGYAVLQAKMHLHHEDTGRNLSWLTAQVKSELRAWAAPDTKRTPQPDFLLFATNVRLSPSGKDAIKETINEQVSELKLPLRDFRVWDRDDIRGLLDDAPGIRAKYSPLITVGDLITQLLDRSQADEANFADALILHAASEFSDDFHLKLSQTGTYGDRRIALADVFVDLPLNEPLQLGSVSHDDEFEAIEPNVVAGLIQRFDYLTTATDAEEGIKKKCVLIGGPGQGKSTVTQFLAQIYRASFIADSTLAHDQDILPDINRVLKRAETIEVPLPKARRWPFRIDLTHLADSLASGESNGLLEYMTKSIEKSSERVIHVDRLHEWLGAFPWLLILDGLDEVPNSSNRDQVIRSIRDFGLKSAACGGDVTIVATTRPQGYSEEFDPKVYTHMELASLPLDVALDYAKGFISVRMEGGSTRAESVFKGLLRASADESTSKLFSSPLQVTILTVLIETSGQVPKDRWKLFLRYYDVINQRELEKGGELSELLQDYETDVVYLHRHIGNLLQRRSAGVGDTSATISREEFLAIVHDRLTEMDHEPAKVAFLTKEFLRLVTDRLVFLAVVSSGRIGFEIRSLQEFMAGAYVSDLPDSEIIPTIRDLARIPYWRNVVLFAIGYVFTSKDHLKAEIPQLCDELDDDDIDGAVVRSGGLLALDILLDGASQSQPRFAKRLARRAALLLDGPIQQRVDEFSRFSDDVVAPILRGATQSLSETTPSGWINRVIASWPMLTDADVRRSHVLSIFELAGEASRSGILHIASERDDPALLESLEEHIGTYSPSVVLSEMKPVFWRGPKTDDQSNANWMTIALRAVGRMGQRNIISLGGSESSLFKIAIMPLSAKVDEWAVVAELKFSHPGWKFLANIGKFVQSPSTEKLAELILEMKTLDTADRRFAQTGPWVLAACHAAAVRYVEGSSAASIDQALDNLAAQCLRGNLGTPDDWRSAERRLSNLPFDAGLRRVGPANGREPEASLPIWSGLAEEGISLFGCNFSYRMPTSSESIEQVDSELRGLVRLLKTANGRMHIAAAFHYGSFVASMSVDRSKDLGSDATLEGESWDELRTFLEKTCHDLPDGVPAWAGWAFSNESVNVQRSDYPRMLEKLGGMALNVRFPIMPSGQLRWVTGGATYSTEGWKRYRLAFAYAPGLVHELEEYELAYIASKAGEGKAAAQLAELVQLMNASESELVSGAYDDSIRSVCIDYERGESERFNQVLRMILSGNDKSRNLIRRIAKVAVDEFPVQATRYVEMLNSPPHEIEVSYGADES